MPVFCTRKNSTVNLSPQICQKYNHSKICIYKIWFNFYHFMGNVRADEMLICSENNQ